MTVLYLYT